MPNVYKSLKREGGGYQSSIANARKRGEIATRKITYILTTLTPGNP